VDIGPRTPNRMPPSKKPTKSQDDPRQSRPHNRPRNWKWDVCLRPALSALDPLQKFLPWVWLAILLLLASGSWMLFTTFGGFAAAGRGRDGGVREESAKG
jgi:hypothetical protein